jgi:protein-S-isoprenylcysteine O-methyltransferase Ste14
MGLDIVRMVSRALVLAQFAAIAILLLPVGRRGLVGLGLMLAGLGLGWLAWTVRHNRLGNFNIRPESKPGATLITAGPYRWVRHPMYTGVLVAGLGAVAAGPSAWRVAAWLGLFGVLIAKARLEEAALRRQFVDYEGYRRNRSFLLPGVW